MRKKPGDLQLLRPFFSGCNIHIRAICAEWITGWIGKFFGGSFSLLSLSKSEISCVDGRSRVKQLTDAMAKLNKIQSMLQFKKRSRPESSTQERASIAAASGRMTTASHGKLISSAVTNHVSTADISGASRAGDKNKSINPSKRIRTSMADVRVCICELYL
jgi:hypothetical protein